MTAPGTAPRRSLPVLAPITPAALAAFDATQSAPLALSVLRHELGTVGVARAVLHLARRAVLADPLRALARPRDRDDALTRQQLRPVLLLDDVLRLDLGLDEHRSHALLGVVVRTSGARFLAQFQPALAVDDWAAATPAERARFAKALVSRLFNARVARVEALPDALAFDVAACRFVDLLGALDRARLAPLFCEVDRAFVDRDGSPLALHRAGTLAEGAARCDFRFTLRAS